MSDEPQAARRTKPKAPAAGATAAAAPSVAAPAAAPAAADDIPVATRRSRPTAAADSTAPAAQHADPNASGVAPSTAAPTAASTTAATTAAAANLDLDADLIDYDSMSYDRFAELLMRTSLAERRVQKANYKAAQQPAKASSSQAPEKFFDGTGGYTYRDMLTRVLEELRKRRGGTVSATEKAKLPMPQVERAGAKVTSLSNLMKICAALGRTPEELKDFIDKQLVTRSSIDSNNALIIRIQNVRTAQMENIINKYVEEFCLCTECHGINTTLDRDPGTRLVKLTCKACGAFRNLASHTEKSVFAAQTVRRAQVRNRTM